MRIIYVILIITEYYQKIIKIYKIIIIEYYSL